MNHAPDPRESGAGDPPAEPWLDAARRELDRSIDDYDAATLSRLNRARQAALAAGRAPRRWLLPAGLAAAMSLVVALGMWRALPGPSAPALVVSPEDYAMLADDGALELSQDLEFYAWLDAQPAPVGG